MEWTKDSIEYKFMADFYKFCKKYYEVKNTDEYWKELTEESIKLSRKYGDTEFVSNLILGFINYAERMKNGHNEM